MKKIALALALAGLSATAFAQSSTTIYGIVDMGVNHSSGVTGLNSGLQSGSRLGFRGKEDLGGGNAAIFGLEAGFSADTGSFDNHYGNGLFNRQSWVGLSSTTLGTVKFGRQLTPIYNTLYDLDPFQAGLAGDATHLMNDGGRSVSNTVNYSTSMGPVSGEMAYSFGESLNGLRYGNTVGASTSVDLGSLKLAGAYNHADVAGVTNRTMLIGGTYDLHIVKAHVAFADNDNGGLKSRNYLLGVSAPITSVDTVMGSMVKLQDRSDTNIGATQLALGMTHSLSTRTNLYASLGETKYDAASTDKVVNFGIRHKF